MKTGGRRPPRAATPAVIAPDHSAPADSAAVAAEHPAVPSAAIAPQQPTANAEPPAPDHPAADAVGDPAAAAEAAETMAPDHAASAAAARPLPAAATAGRSAVADDAFAALAEAQVAVARAWNAVGGELAGFGRCANDLAAHAAIEMLGAKSIADALQINARFAGESLDGWFEHSVKLSELGAALAAESSQPIVAFLGRGWIRAVGLTR